jgi:hypothetical protein
MQNRQKVIIVLTLFGLLIVFLFPPVISLSGGNCSHGDYFIFKLPSRDSIRRPESRISPDWRILLARTIAVTLAGGNIFLIFGLKNGKD